MLTGTHRRNLDIAIASVKSAIVEIETARSHVAASVGAYSPEANAVDDLMIAAHEARRKLERVR